MSDDYTATETQTQLDIYLEQILPYVSSVYDWLYDFMTAQGWTEGAAYLKTGYEWYVSDFSSVAEQVLSITVLVVYYYVF